MKNVQVLKSLLVTICLGGASVAHAENWSKIFVCENGNAYIDVNQDERRNLQLVLKGANVLTNLYRAGMIYPQYGQQEYVIRGLHEELRQVSPTETEPVSLGGVFFSHDFKKMIAEVGGSSAMEIEPRGSDLAIKLLSVTSGNSCDGYIDSDGMCRGQSNFHKTYYFDREYVLHGCASL